MAAALVLAGVLQAGAMVTRNLSLGEALPPSALAAGYSVMYAVAGAGYAATGSLGGVLLHFVAPSTAILAGVGLTLTLALTAIGALGERRLATASAGRSTPAAETTVVAADGPVVAAPGAERPPIRGRSDS